MMNAVFTTRTRGMVAGSLGVRLPAPAVPCFVRTRVSLRTPDYREKVLSSGRQRPQIERGRCRVLRRTEIGKATNAQSGAFQIACGRVIGRAVRPHRLSRGKRRRSESALSIPACREGRTACYRA